MNCGRVSNQLSAYIDRELTGAEMMLIRHHLGDCGECQAEYEALCRMKMLLGRLAAPEPHSDFVGAALRRWERQTAAAPHVWGAWRVDVRSLRDRWLHWRAARSWQPAFIRWQMPLGVAAASLAAVLILTSVYLHGPRHSDALVATSPVPVLEGHDPLSHTMTWEWTSLEAAREPPQGPRIYGGRRPMDWVTVSSPSGQYLSFP